ncbi:major capsid protein [Alistipes sp.]|uniref:major capsid protein n=1 Tax=Alistipes sp. TaxID=1872444 RepID=UPI003529B3D8
MNKTLFIELVQKWFRTIAGQITETINGKKEAPTYLHETMLQREYSPDLKWDSASIDGSIVAADVVAMDSELPVKRRDSLGRASGDIPKLGMKLFKGEKLITDMQIMSARGASEAEIVAKLFADAPRCTSGIKEREEEMFLQALQTGQLLIEDEENVGTAIRADFGYRADNKFGATTKWGEEGYTPLSDIARIIESASAKGDTIRTIGVSLNDYNLIRRSQEARELSANFRGLVILDAAKLPIPTKSQFNEAFADEYGVNLLIIDRSVRTEKDGVRTSRKAFVDGTLVFLTTEPSEKVGRLVYGTLAEETNPVAGVSYEKVDGYILLSKYSKNDPLREYTSSQALALPVIDNVTSIYVLNTQEAQVLNDTDKDAAGRVLGRVAAVSEGAEGNNANLPVYGQQFMKADVIAALKTIGVSTSSNIGDTKLLERINSLSDEQEAALKAALGVATDPEE